MAWTMFGSEVRARAGCRCIPRQTVVGLLAALVAMPAWAGEFAAGPLVPAISLLEASHSTVAPVSPTVEHFNETPAHIGDAEANDASIGAALSINDVFGVAEGTVQEPMVSVEVELEHADDPARLSADLSGPLAVANGLPLLTVREMMAPPLDLLPDDAAAGPIALNASGHSLETSDHPIEKVDVRRYGPRARRHGMQ